ncbi:substrate-binding domain-containing protein [Streptomyces sp. NPDC044984]|uniref:substrate-binding domain-containing protein n=1 Tax=Streptomyces sp. NPDC044984 TaxID=3154335 RepID=UPI0033F695DC
MPVLVVGEWVVLVGLPSVDGAGHDRGAVEAARELGRRVPDDLGIVGFDDWDALTLGSRPPLSSVSMRLEELGRQAAHRLFGSRAGEDHGSVTVACELVVRDSSQRLAVP